MELSNKYFYEYKLSESDKEYCLKHGSKMALGFSTYSFKHGKNQSLDVYNIGKIGEFVFYKFLREFERKKLLKIKHTPFRGDYEKINFKDDFIIEINGFDYQIEVRTKGRGVEPKEHYECCTDCIKPNFIYVFLSFNKKKDIVHVLGYANWENFRNYATIALKGDSCSNFSHKVNEFNIKIKNLSNIYNIVNDYTKVKLNN